MRKVYIIILILALISPNLVFATNGCCSWHGGVSHCGNNGYYICNDGTQSPSCTCYTINDNTFDNCYSLVDEEDIIKLEEEVNSLKDEIKTLKSEKQKVENKLSDYKIFFWGTLITFGIYAFYKNAK